MAVMTARHCREREGVHARSSGERGRHAGARVAGQREGSGGAGGGARLVGDGGERTCDDRCRQSVTMTEL